MHKVFTTAVLAGILMVAMAVPALANNGKSGDSKGRAGTEIEVTVLSTDLTYQSIVKTDLPMHGPFQKLIPTDDGLTTEFGPGDQGYVGGRWWVDVNGDGHMDAGDAYFLCPLLGPGY